MFVSTYLSTLSNYILLLVVVFYFIHFLLKYFNSLFSLPCFLFFLPDSLIKYTVHSLLPWPTYKLFSFLKLHLSFLPYNSSIHLIIISFFSFINSLHFYSQFQNSNSRFFFFHIPNCLLRIFNQSFISFDTFLLLCCLFVLELGGIVCFLRFLIGGKVILLA